MMFIFSQGRGCRHSGFIGRGRRFSFSTGIALERHDAGLQTCCQPYADRKSCRNVNPGRTSGDCCRGGVINADAAALLQQFAELTSVPVIPTLMGWGCIPDDHELMAGMVGLQTAHRYGNATLLASDMVFGIGNRFANRHTGSVEKYTEGRKIVHIDIEPTQIGRVLCPDLGIVSDAKAALTLLVEVAQEMQKAGRLPCRKEWVADCQQRKRTLLRKTHFDNVPVKPQRVYEEMNKAFGRDVCYVTTIGLSQIAAAQMLHVFKDRHWINCGRLVRGLDHSGGAGVCAADPERKVVAISATSTSSS